MQWYTFSSHLLLSKYSRPSFICTTLESVGLKTLCRSGYISYPHAFWSLDAGFFSPFPDVSAVFGSVLVFSFCSCWPIATRLYYCEIIELRSSFLLRNKYEWIEVMVRVRLAIGRTRFVLLPLRVSLISSTDGATHSNILIRCKLEHTANEIPFKSNSSLCRTRNNYENFPYLVIYLYITYHYINEQLK